MHYDSTSTVVTKICLGKCRVLHKILIDESKGLSIIIDGPLTIIEFRINEIRDCKKVPCFILWIVI